MDTPPRATSSKKFKLLPTILIAVFFHGAVFGIFYFHFKNTGSSNDSVNLAAKQDSNTQVNKIGFEQYFPVIQPKEAKQTITNSVENDVLIVQKITPPAESSKYTKKTPTVIHSSTNQSQADLKQDDDSKKTIITKNIDGSDNKKSPTAVKKLDLKQDDDSKKIIVEKNINDDIVLIDSTIVDKEVTHNSSPTIAPIYIPLESISINSKDIPSQQDVKDRNLLNVDLPRIQQRQIISDNQDNSALQKQVANVKINTEDLHNKLSNTIQSIKSSNQQQIQKSNLEKKHAYEMKQQINKAASEKLINEKITNIEQKLNNIDNLSEEPKPKVFVKEIE